ncbi:MAG: MoxR-like ATPase [Cyclobacteriaceae bacterium]|jgi:MoxR-like ATPase
MAEELSNTLEAGTYELLRSRIVATADQLKSQVNKLNDERKSVFGTIETKVLASERITTNNNCIPWDMFSFGSKFLFGYNVHVGLRSEVKIEDVFSFYEYQSDHTFHELKLNTIITDKVFLDDFQKLYKYYKNTQFLRFTSVGPFFHMVFRIGKDVNDVKTFKWQIQEEELIYIDNRSDHEYKFPAQYEFEWKKTRREDYRDGLHPHVSIEDRVFVECVGGDLTIKVEDNTDDGQGIYREDVANSQQTLDDAEFNYAVVGNLILIKAKPYQEADRYLVFNEKLKEVKRIDTLSESGILLPDNHGLIFSNGYYLQSGEFKLFDLNLKDMLFERRITSLNGEDFIYVFYNREKGVYLLLNYNIISQKVENPIVCHGFTTFENGEMCVFKADEEPKKHHAIQIWQTPFTGVNFQAEEKSDSFLQKIGNKEVVRAMAECQDIINLINREEIYGDLYIDIIKKATDTIDTYHWLNTKNYDLDAPLKEIRSVAESAVDEYEKVQKIRETSAKRLGELAELQSQALKKSRASFGKITAYVSLLSEIRSVRGEVISAKDLRYIDQEKLSSFDADLSEAADNVSESCVRFLAQDHALKPFQEKIVEFETKIDKIKKVIDANELLKSGEQIAKELDLLIETVSNLKITDATQTTAIIEGISDIYGSYNQVKNKLANIRKSLLEAEGKAEFNATIKLLEQSVTNYLDICDTPAQCEEYLTKLIVQVEELEGKFSEFEEFIDLISQKREEVYNAFESKKLYLTEQRNKKANQLFQAAERVLSAIRNKSGTLKSKQDINGYFASDLMVEKIRSISNQLVSMGETVKSDDLTSQLKTIKEDVLRQLKDKQELFTAGDNIIQMGNHQFFTNNLTLDLSMVVKNKLPHYHLAGTDFFEVIKNEELAALSHLWDQSLISENREVYRAEYLSFSLFGLIVSAKAFFAEKTINLETYQLMSETEKLSFVQRQMATRFGEGYIKGVHEFDTILILNEIITLNQVAGVLKYGAEVRALAKFFWNSCVNDETKKLYERQVKAAALILSVFPSSREFEGIVNDLKNEIESQEAHFYDVKPDYLAVAQYLFDQLSEGDNFIISQGASECHQLFLKYLKQSKAVSKFQASLKSLNDTPPLAMRMIRQWLSAFIKEIDQPHFTNYADEVAALLFYGDYTEFNVKKVSLSKTLEGLKGSHNVIEDGKYNLHLNNFFKKLSGYTKVDALAFEQLAALKKRLSENYRNELRLHEFKPRVLSSFVRNKLIDTVYFPLIGNNLAKQIGTAGENKRTDLMGLLLLVSPPGYGKTTLMEYIASRLGVIFMKINGPAIGHEVTSLDPADAPNAASAEELQKLNLSFEMGNNVMIYLDDIQHCNPEFLQKFISMCDAQRKIEGVYKGKTKTYDFRGKKVCVVMAGNPYTESGDKFQIPDMLSNRADIYNLGDVIGDSGDAFKLSYIENCLTSNSILSRLVSRSLSDVRTVIKLAEQGSGEGLKFEVNHSAEELQEYVSVIKHLMRARDVVLAVNSQYIASAAMAEEYRVAPAFKLQGSYRDMNKLAEKILPMMNVAEVETIIQSHYENESQTLTSNAEANLLRFKQLTEVLSPKESDRWNYIIEVFSEKQKQLGHGQNAKLVESIDAIADNLRGILDKISENKPSKK